MIAAALARLGGGAYGSRDFTLWLCLMKQIFATRARRALVMLAAIALAALAIARAGDRDGVAVSRADFVGRGLSWPLTVDAGRLGCRARAVWFKAPDGREYAVNGAASNKGGADLDLILSVDEETLRLLKAAGADVSFEPRLNPRDLIAEGLKLC